MERRGFLSYIRNEFYLFIFLFQTVMHRHRTTHGRNSVGASARVYMSAGFFDEIKKRKKERKENKIT